MRFWDNVNKHIEIQKTSQDWIALYCGVKPAKFKNWIKKGIYPDATVALRLAEVFGVSLESLFSENKVEDERFKYELMHMMKDLTDEQILKVKSFLIDYLKSKNWLQTGVSKN